VLDRVDHSADLRDVGLDHGVVQPVNAKRLDGPLLVFLPLDRASNCVILSFFAMDSRPY